MSSQAPRPPHPPPASPAIARVLPMVPEVSLFTHDQVLPPYPGPSPSQQLARPHLLPPPASQVQPPRPHLPPSHHLLPQSDLSREFLRSEATLFLSGSSEIPARRVQFQGDSAGQQHQAGAGQPHHVGHHQAVDRAGQADRISFPNQVQQLHHHALNHDQVQPPQHQVTKHKATLQPHNAAEPYQQSHLVPQQSPPPALPTAPHQLPPSIPPDIMSVLAWQNDQLAKLQDQVARLLAASPQGPAQHAGHLSPGQGGHPPAHVATNQAEAGCSPVLKRVSTPPTSRMSVSTSTSTLLPDMQTPLGRLSEGSKPPPSPQSGACLDLPDYPTTPSGSTTSGKQMRRVGDMNTLDSPVLGESVSMYEGNTSASDKGQEDVEEIYENILGQVKRLLAQDENHQQDVAANRQEIMQPITTTRQHNIPPISPPQPPPTQPSDHLAPAQSTTTATWDRLRQLGVSFISPSDLVQPAPSSSNPYNSIYPLQANIPSTTMVSPSPDTSLAINNLALKYLSDAELGRLAAQHNRQVKTSSSQETRPAEYSLASHQFLARYGLGGGHHGGQAQGVAGQAQDFMHRQPHHVYPRPESPPQSTPHPITPHLPARPQHSSPHPSQQPARAAAPAMDRVLDITAIRQQSRLW